jgi:CHAT domain-containing protein/tetratricopeptide (TPR) repeat protein
MIALLALSTCAGAPVQSGGDLLQLSVDRSIHEVLADGDGVVRTAALDAGYTEAPTIGETFLLEVAESGPYRVELRSHFFDAYLVLQDGDGGVLGEDDDGLLGRHARLVTELSAGLTYSVTACAVRGGRGAYELSIATGRPAELSTPERANAELQDAEARVAAVEDLLGLDHPDTIVSVDALASLLSARGDYARARELHERAVEAGERVLGPGHPETAAYISNLAALLRDQGDHARARPLFERALEIYERVFGLDHSNTADMLGNLAGVLQQQGEFDAAETMFRRVLGIYEEVHGPVHKMTGLGLNNLANVLQAQGDYAAAVQPYERALSIFEAELGAEHPWTATTLDNLGAVLCSKGDYDAARPLYERALSVKERALGPEHPDTARSLGSLGLMLSYLGDYEAARSNLERALGVYERTIGPDHPRTATVLNNLAGLFKEQGDYATAKPLFERALAIRERSFGPDHHRTAISLNDLGLLLLAEGDLEGAELLLERATAVFERRLGPDHPDTVSSFQTLTLLLADQGKLEAAHANCERVLAFKERALGATHPSTAGTLHDLAILRARRGTLEAALPALERALEIRVKTLGTTHLDTFLSQRSLALLLLDLDRAAEAAELLARSREEWFGYHHYILASLSEGECYAYLARVAEQLEVALAVSRRLGSQQPVGRTYEEVLRWKGQVARLMLSGRDRMRADMTPEQRDLVRELNAAQGRLSTLSFAAEVRTPEHHAEQLRAVSAERNALERALTRSIAEQGSDADVPTPEHVRAGLPPGTAFLDFLLHRTWEGAPKENGRPIEPGHWSAREVTVWITRPDREWVTEVELGPEHELARAIEAHLRLTVRGSSVARGVSVVVAADDAGTQDIRRLLWEPLAPHLEGVGTVFVSPDGVLGTLPFETLPLGEGRFAVEDHGFVYLQNAAGLATGDPTTEAQLDRLLVAGGVDFGVRDEAHDSGAPADSAMSSRPTWSGTWAELPATERESRIVAELHADGLGQRGERLLLQRGDATEERLKEQFPRFRALHLATHGFFNPGGVPSLWDIARSEVAEDRPQVLTEGRRLVGKLPGLLSGLVCAGANAPAKGGEDGYLTAEEVGWLDLSGVELVVLSACDTGLGRAQSGEGLIGLRRAFRTAGAKTVVSSLWAVSDNSTAELMRSFYTNLWVKRLGRLDALRRAQLEMLEENRAGGDPRPATWGAFVLSGAWR